MRKALGICLASAWILSCGKKDFNRAPSPAQPMPETTYQSQISAEAPAAAVPSTSVPPPISTAESQALQECLKQWTNPPHPFTTEALRQPQVVSLKQSSQNNELLYSDNVATDKDKLILINFDISIGNQSSIALKNPKGWYCLNVTAKVINNFKIALACKSQLAIISKLAQNDHNFQVEREACP